MNTARGTLFERLGGEDGLAALTRRFYGRVLSDPELAPFFASTAMEKQQRMQTEFLSAVLDGPVHYTGVSLREAHGKRGIQSRHFHAFLAHLVAAMEASGVEDRDVRDVIERVETYHDEVVGGSTTAG